MTKIGSGTLALADGDMAFEGTFAVEEGVLRLDVASVAFDTFAFGNGATLEFSSALRTEARRSWVTLFTARKIVGELPAFPPEWKVDVSSSANGAVTVACRVRPGMGFFIR